MSNEAWFWGRVRKSEGCWEWTGSRGARGYGGLIRPGMPRYAHRASWQLTNGPIPRGMCVLHTCDNPPCVRPDHLRLGTHQDNTADMIAKGRAGWITKPEQWARGESHPRWNPARHVARQPAPARGTRNAAAKITDEQVRELRARRDRGESYPALGAAFGISKTAARFVASRQTWAHVE